MSADNLLPPPHSAKGCPTGAALQRRKAAARPGLEPKIDCHHPKFPHKASELILCGCCSWRICLTWKTPPPRKPFQDAGRADLPQGYPPVHRWKSQNFHRCDKSIPDSRSAETRCGRDVDRWVTAHRRRLTATPSQPDGDVENLLPTIPPPTWNGELFFGMIGSSPTSEQSARLPCRTFPSRCRSTHTP